MLLTNYPQNLIMHNYILQYMCLIIDKFVRMLFSWSYIYL